MRVLRMCHLVELNKSNVTHFGTTNAITRIVESCGWWRGDGGFMWGHPFTNHNLPNGELWHLLCQNVTLDLFGKTSYTLT